MFSPENQFLVILKLTVDYEFGQIFF